MAVSKKVLGMNARNYLYIRRYNSANAKRIADDKLETKKLLIADNLATTNLLAAFYNREEIRDYNWDLPEEGFVIKPARGYGGQGILPIKSWNGIEAVSVNDEFFNKKQLVSHLLDVLDGAYSLQALPDKAYIEERVIQHPFFKKIAPIGIADIRIIVFNKVPVMAMLRLPTYESKGKANLHMGALGIGIDIRTGITTYAIYKDKNISRIPGTKIKTRGIKIPEWNKLLYLASRTQMIIGLGYAGIDIVFDAKRGPLVLEVNSRPGLSIQNANRESLRTRLERVENMIIPTAQRGVEVGQSLFAADFADKVSQETKVLNTSEPITLKNKDVEKEVLAKLDTGAFHSSIDIKLAEELGYEISETEKVYVKSASGEKYRPTVTITFTLAGKKITTMATVVDRSRLKFPIIIGRKNLTGFLINPIITKTPQRGDIPEEDQYLEE